MSRVLAVGLDLVDLERMNRLLSRHGETALRRICREGEVRVESGPGRVAHVAGLFAAKEAVMKALGTGWSAGVGFRQIEVVRRPGGAPAIELHGAARDRAEALGVASLHLSISHDGRTAAAFVVLEAATP